MKIIPFLSRAFLSLALCLPVLGGCAKNPDGSYTLSPKTIADTLLGGSASPDTAIPGAPEESQDPSLIQPGTYQGPGRLALQRLQNGKYSVTVFVPATRKYPAFEFECTGYQDKNEVICPGALIDDNVNRGQTVAHDTSEVLRQVSPDEIELSLRGEKPQDLPTRFYGYAKMFGKYKKK